MMTARKHLTQLVPENGTFIELGVAAGNFACEVLTAHPTLSYIGIDRWCDHHDEAERLKATERLSKFNGRAALHKSTFAKALPQFSDECADVVYVDGYAHTGQEGGRTLRDWWAKVKPGGVMAGHDYCERWPLTVKEVDRFAAELGVDVAVINDRPYPSWYLRKNKPALIPQGSSVVIVGNGPSVMRAQFGSRIDGFDEVIRFNGCRCKGFETHTGTRTTIWTTFGRGMLPGDANIRPAKIILAHGESEAGRCAYPALWRYPVPQEFYQQLRSEIQAGTASQNPERLLPSSGYLVTRWLLDTGQVQAVTLTGFDHFQKHFSSQHHYWHKGPFGRPKEHDGDFEAESLAKYAADGRLSYLTSP